LLVFPRVLQSHYVVDDTDHKAQCLEGAQNHLISDLNHSTHILVLGGSEEKSMGLGLGFQEKSKTSYKLLRVWEWHMCLFSVHTYYDISKNDDFYGELDKHTGRTLIPS
jgi:hypothetical protein